MQSQRRKRLSEETKRRRREGRLITERSKAVPEVHIDYDSRAGYPERIRIAFERHEGDPRIDLRIWRPANYRDWPHSRPGPWKATTEGITITPLYVLGSVIKALKDLDKEPLRWIEKGWRSHDRIPERIRIALEEVGDHAFVDVRTWALQQWLWRATERGLVIPLDLLREVIEGLRRFARPMRKVKPNYLRPRFVAPPAPMPLFEALFGDTDSGSDEDRSRD